MVSAKAVMDNSASVLGLIKAVTTPPQYTDNDVCITAMHSEEASFT